MFLSTLIRWTRVCGFQMRMSTLASNMHWRMMSSCSASSAIPKSGRMPLRAPCSRRMLPHSRWKVEIHTRRVTWAGRSSSSRLLISPAAFRVNVMAAISPGAARPCSMR